MESYLLNCFSRLALTSTAIAPVLLTYAWVAFRADDTLAALLFGSTFVFLVVICQALLWYAKQKLPRSNFKVTSVEAADRENIAFLLIYILPLFTADFDSLNWDIWLPTLVIFGAVVATGFSYHFNPLLGLQGWHFYKVGTAEGVTYVMITRKELRSAKGDFTIAQLTEYIVLDLGEKNAL